MDDWEHFGGRQDSVDFQKTLVEVFAFFDCLLVVVSLCKLDIEGLVEAVDLVFHWAPKCVNFWFCEPVTVHIAFSLVFDEVFELIGGFTNSSP